MKELILLVGPPGSGKSTYAQQLLNLTHPCWYINQDSQGKEGHFDRFKDGIAFDHDIIVDRMNFSKEQRNRYLIPAKEAGFKTKIIVLHESFETCFKRCLERKGHETITTEQAARSALGFFFKSYERVEDNEADEVVRIWPEGDKPKAIICDLDGTLCNIDHRLHFVKGEGKKNWKGFFDGIPGDKLNEWCRDILRNIWGCPVLCSGRPDSHRKQTEEWLKKHEISYDNLFMRQRDDFRSDTIVKEQILDFEILTRYKPYFIIDDRKTVVDMWRKRGYTCLACAEGDF
jgi:predicted kinase